jgi:hypothetical protein
MYRLNFAYNQNPNSGGLPDWPEHRFPANKNCMHFLPGSVGPIQDDYREERLAIFNEPTYAEALFS